jgi:ATP-dependent RNA helicase DHR2
MPEKVHTKFNVKDDEADHNALNPEPSEIPQVQGSLFQKRPEKSLKANGNKKRSPHEAFEEHGKDRNGLPQPQMSNLPAIRELQIVQFPDDDSKGGVNGSKNRFNSTDPQAFLAKRSRLKVHAQKLLPLRKALPIASHADEIRTKLRSHDVLLLVGETGSGKSTQVPQFLMDEPWCRASAVSMPAASDGYSPPSNSNSRASTNIKIKVGGCIAITQPRRLAAISLAARVAAELGTPLGSSSPSSQVGYSVRFDTSVSPCTRIKFLTEGMLLQEMLRDPCLREYSAVIVDEVHERGVNVDLVLGFLRRMVAGDRGKNDRGGVGLKVVVMSATADMETIEEFFPHVGSEHNGKPVNGSHISTTGLQDHENGNIDEDHDESDSESSWSGLSSSSPAPPNIQSSRRSLSSTTNNIEACLSNPLLTSCHIKGRQYPVETIYTPSPVQDILDSALHTILHIHTYEPLPGDVLVFLTGQEAVENLASLCHEAYLSLIQDPKTRSNIPKLLILPLFAALPQHAQQRVFEKTPSRTRKVILSTNIAETSLTVPGIRYVVDSGKCKKKQFRSRLGLDSLLVKPISKSAAKQRKGRAGREAPGTCYRLYTERDYLLLDQDNDPEILRCDLSQMVLDLKARGVDDVVNFPLLTQPPREALERALLHLLQLQALDPETGKITSLGISLAKLPLSASLGRVLLAAAEPQYGCLPECIDVIAALSVENIFLNTTTEEKKEEAEAARRELYRREGDHLTLLAAVQAYNSESSDRRSWCQRHFISHRAMQAVMDVRKQLLAQSKRLMTSKSPPPPPTPQSSKNTNDAIDLPNRLLKAFLTGFVSNTARLMPDGSYRTMMGNQTVAVHPSSVLFGRKCEAIVYNEFVFTQRSYARGVSAVQLDWVGELLG